MELSGKNIVYIGGCSGIGLATCKLLIENNIKNIVILDKKENREGLNELQQINKNIAIHYRVFDIACDITEIRKIFSDILAEIKTIDVLVNGAGIFDEHACSLLLKVNLEGVINTTIVAFENFDKRKGGRGISIVNIASLAGLEPIPSIAIYSATKAGVISLGKSLSKVYDVSGITIYTICPGATETSILRMNNSFMDLDPNLEETLKIIPKQTAEECGKNIVDAIEQNLNGAIWLLDMGKLELVKDQKCFQLPEELAYS